MEKKLYELTIDPELRDFIPPLSEQEYENLEELILLDGCEEALIVWNGVLVDGHNRYRICHEHNIPFAILEKDFEGKEQAKLWMARRQLGRRNLKPFQKCELVIPLENALKDEAEERRRHRISEYRKSGETVKTSSPSMKTRDIMAEMAEVSFDTIKKVKVILQEADEETKAGLRQGKATINAVYKKLQRKRDRVREDEDGSEKPGRQIKDEPEIQVDKPTIFNNTPELDEDDVEPPEDFADVEAQVEICIQDFMMNFRATMKWIGQHHVFGKNEAAVKALLKEGYEAAVDTLHDRFVELKGENK